MHCPDGVSGAEYIELVAAVSILLSKNLDTFGTFLLAEFLQSVSYQLFNLAAFKEFGDGRRNLPPPIDPLDPIDPGIDP